MCHADIDLKNFHPEKICFFFSRSFDERQFKLSFLFKKYFPTNDNWIKNARVTVEPTLSWVLSSHVCILNSFHICRQTGLFYYRDPSRPFPSVTYEISFYLTMFVCSSHFRESRNLSRKSSGQTLATVTRWW